MVSDELKRVVYLVYGFDHYEYPCATIKAFVSESDANELLGRISAYGHKKPDFPNDASDDEFDAWDMRFKQWSSGHPSGDGWNRDGFAVMPLELIEPSTPEAK